MGLRMFRENVCFFDHVIVETELLSRVDFRHEPQHVAVVNPEDQVLGPLGSSACGARRCWMVS